MVAISMFGSGEGLVWVTGRGYSTTKKSPVYRNQLVCGPWCVVGGLFANLSCSKLHHGIALDTV